MRSVVDRNVSTLRMTEFGSMVLVNSGFLTRNTRNLSENNPQFGHAPSELFGSHVQGRKFLKISV